MEPPMQLTQPVTPSPHKQSWFYPGLLPKGTLVLLDGATAVGKSMFCAHLASKVSHYFKDDDRPAMLYLTSLEQKLTRDRHLFHQQCNVEKIVTADIHDMAHFQKPDELPDITACFQAYLEKLVGDTKPQIIVIDDFEEMVSDFNSKTSRDCRDWWRILNYVAIRYRCTIIVTRRNGMNLARHYGPLNRAGTEFCDFILTMHWHPYDPSKRVISVAKNRYGPLGMQWHFLFHLDSTTSLHEMERHQHVRPSKCPQTWQADPGLVHRTNQVVEEIKEQMDGVAKPVADLKEHFKAQKISEKVIDHAIAKMGIEHSRVGIQWYYVPTEDMVYASLMKSVNQARTRGAETAAGSDTPPSTTTTEEPRTHGVPFDFDLTPTIPSTLKPEAIPILEPRTHGEEMAA